MEKENPFELENDSLFSLNVSQVTPIVVKEGEEPFISKESLH